MIVVCFDHDKFIGNVVISCSGMIYKDELEKHLPEGCSHYDVVSEDEYRKIYGDCFV